MHDVHIINLSLPHEIKILADKKEAISPPSSLNITRVSSYEIAQYISIAHRYPRLIENKNDKCIKLTRLLNIFSVGKSSERTS